MSTILSDTDLSDIVAEKVADARGSACPGPLLEAKKAIGSVPLGGVLEVWSGDPATKTDIEAWANKVGHGFLGYAQADGYDRVFLRRSK